MFFTFKYKLISITETEEPETDGPIDEKDEKEAEKQIIIIAVIASLAVISFCCLASLCCW